MSDFNTSAERYLRDAVAIPSTTGSEGLMAGYLESSFKKMGAEVDLQHVDNDRYNVIARAGNGPIKLMLCTHTDVIPSLDESRWSTPPFEAVSRHDRIYGRGSTDAKGSLAAMMEALERIIGSGKKLSGSVAVAAVVEEETGKSLGARKVVEKYAPEMVIIGEPTMLRLAIAHKGALRPIITVQGMAAHASSPSSGINAIMLMGRALETFGEYGRKVSDNYDPLLGRSSFEITMIQGGERINVIPDRCSISVDRRLVSNESMDASYEELKGIVAELEKKLDAEMSIELVSAYPPSKTDRNEKIVRLAMDALSVRGMQSDPIGFPAGCDMWAFRSKNIPTAVLGPGSIEQAHVIGEYIEKRQLNLAADIYEDIIYSALV